MKTVFKYDYYGEQYEIPKNLSEEFDAIQGSITSTADHSRDSDRLDMYWKRFNDQFAQFKKEK